MKKSLIIIFLLNFGWLSFSYAGDTTSLVSAWKLDDDTTTTADSYGSNTLSENGAVTSVAGQFGTAHHFGSTSDYWSITDGSQVGLDMSSSFSVTGWGELSNFTNGRRILCGKGSTGYSFGIDENGKLALTLQTTVVTVSTGAMTLDTWYHLGVVFNDSANTVEYYINGSLDSTISSVTAVPAGNATDFNIASGNGNYTQWGLTPNTNNNIDDVMIFSRVLSATEVSEIKTNGSASFISGGRKRMMVVAWAMPRLKEAFAQAVTSVSDNDVKDHSSIANKIIAEFGAGNVQVESSPEETRIHIFKDGKRVTTLVTEWTETLLPGDLSTPRKFSLIGDQKAKDCLGNWIDKVKNDKRMK